MKYLVSTRETWVQEYEVEADSPEDAKKAVKADDAALLLEDSFEYSDTNDSENWAVTRIDNLGESDPWLHPEPLSAEQLAEVRKEQIKRASELLKNVPEKFTCDDCGLANVCKLAFDAYNTNGDCLYDK